MSIFYKIYNQFEKKLKRKDFDAFLGEYFPARMNEKSGKKKGENDRTN